MRIEGYCYGLCLSVCPSSIMFIRPTNDTTYLKGSEDPTFCGDFAAFKRVHSSGGCRTVPAPRVCTLVCF